MAEYIEREAALAALCEYCNGSCKEIGVDACAEYRNIMRIPTADVVEVRHGEWVTEGDCLKNTTCSLCNYWVETPYGKTAYCPNCGAKMDGKGEGE